jgi:membrane associated rhomboid family serine protease
MVNFWTISFIATCLIDLEPFNVFSATFLLIALNVVLYFMLRRNEQLKQTHFTCSSVNLAQQRYWTLITSSLAHKDINHLLCNMFALAVGGPSLEYYLGFKYTIAFVCLAGIASSIASECVHGHPSMGFSGVIYAIEGFFIRSIDFDNLPTYMLEQALFYCATQGNNVDHAAHIRGFLFGYIAHDMWFNRDWRFGN